MSRRHHYSNPYDYDQRYEVPREKERQRSGGDQARGIEYQDDSLDSINSDEDSYLHHLNLSKEKKTNYYINRDNYQKSSSTKPNKPEKSNNENHHSKDTKTHSECRQPTNRGNSSREAGDSTGERLGRLETMLQQLVKNNTVPAPTSEIKINEKRDPFSLEPRRQDFTTSMWINRIQERSIQSNWDEKTTIMFMTSKMSGIIKTWYNNLPNYDYTWPEWKILISKVFPDNTDFVTMLKRLVTRLKQTNESMSNYYFSKMYLIEACKISGEDAVSCLIDGLNNHTIQEEAKSQNFLTPETLFSQYLTMLPEYSIEYAPENAENPDPSSDAWYCQPETHFPEESVQPPEEAFGRNEEVLYRNNDTQEFMLQPAVQSSHSSSPKKRPAPVHSRLDKRFIKPNNFKNTNKVPLAARFCTICSYRGHLARNCRTVLKLKTLKLQNHTHSKSFVKDCYINNVKLPAFIDTGSTIVTIKEEDAQILNLNVRPVFNVIEVYGGGCISIIGEVDFLLKIDSVETNIRAVVVPNNVQEMSLIIGQEFLNKKNIVMCLKDGHLKFYESRLTN